MHNAPMGDICSNTLYTSNSNISIYGHMHGLPGRIQEFFWGGGADIQIKLYF